MSKLTNQQIFDKCAEHLMTQGQQSVMYNQEGDGTCYYRGPHGLKCAAGIFIPDAQYNDDMELNTFATLCGKEPWLAEQFEEDNAVELVNNLQKVHDTQEDIFNMKSLRLSLEHVAEEFGLSHEVLNTNHQPSDQPTIKEWK